MKTSFSGNYLSPDTGKRIFWWVLVIVLLCAWGARLVHGAEEPGRMLKIFTREEAGVTHFYVQNLEVGNVTTTFKLELSNLTASTNLPCTATLAGKETVEVFSLTPVNPSVPCDYRYANSCILGSANAVHDDAQVYALPFAPGSSFKVSQGYHGSFSHSGPDDYAIDWKMPEGTPVHAAREGLVVKSRDDSNVGGPDRKYLNSANSILIQHADGTIGMYGHLQQGGNKVKVGDHVNAGDLIGLSGNTGFAKGPHLHFAVFIGKNGSERLSLPVKFRTADNPALTLTDGLNCKAPVNAAPLAHLAATEAHAGT